MKAQGQIICFSAGSRPYCESVIKVIDPEKKYITGLLSRENCDPFKVGS